jgi:hypothetical protein
MAGRSKPWTPGEATEAIRAIGRSNRLSLAYKLHARERLLERGILISDVLYVLKNGFVYMDALPSTLEGFYRYSIECTTPNSGGRKVRVITIPDNTSCQIKVVSIMWVDEKERVAGTIIGAEDE